MAIKLPDNTPEKKKRNWAEMSSADTSYTKDELHDNTLPHTSETESSPDSQIANGRLLRGQTVTITLAESGAQYHMHAGVLDMLILQGLGSEPLPFVDNRTFERFMIWAYASLSEGLENYYADMTWEELTQLYLFAYQVGLIGLVNQVIDSMILKDKNHKPFLSRTLAKAYEARPGAYKLRPLFLEFLVNHSRPLDDDHDDGAVYQADVYPPEALWDVGLAFARRATALQWRIDHVVTDQRDQDLWARRGEFYVRAQDVQNMQDAQDVQDA